MNPLKIISIWIIFWLFLFKLSGPLIQTQDIKYLSFYIKDDCSKYLTDFSTKFDSEYILIKCTEIKLNKTQLLAFKVINASNETNEILNSLLKSKDFNLYQFKSESRFSGLGVLFVYFFLLFPIVIIWHKYVFPKEISFREIKPKKLIKCIVFSYFLLIISGYFLKIIFDFFSYEVSTDPQYIKQALETSFLYTLVLVVFVAPLTEELFFRGLIFRFFLVKKKHILGYLVVNLEFVLSHFYIYQSVSINDSTKVFLSMALLILSTLCCWIYYKANTIIAPIILHGINNFFSLIFML